MSRAGIIILTLCFILSCALQIAYADETLAEKSEVAADTVDRGAKKVVNRLKEITCGKGDAACAAQKLKHRAEETTEEVIDKTDAAIDKVD